MGHIPTYPDSSSFSVDRLPPFGRGLPEKKYEEEANERKEEGEEEQEEEQEEEEEEEEEEQIIGLRA